MMNKEAIYYKKEMVPLPSGKQSFHPISKTISA